jgi:hypothetical protein
MKNWKHCILVSIVVIIVAAFAFTACKDRSSAVAGSLQTAIAYEYAMELARAEAIEIQRRIEVYTGYTSIIARVFSNYETTEENSRRTMFNYILRSTIELNESITSIWTAWLPNTIDSHDAGQGQYKSFYTTRRPGSVEDLSTDGYDGWQGFLETMTDKAQLADPVWKDIFGRGNVPVVAVTFPIKNSVGRLVGLVGIDYICNMQGIVDEIGRKIYNGRGLAAVLSNNGTIVAHFHHARVMDNIQTNVRERELLDDNLPRVYQSIRNGGENGQAISLDLYSATLATDVHIIYQPIFISDINTPWCLEIIIPVNEIEPNKM